MSKIVWKDDSDIVIASTLGQVKRIALALRGDILGKFGEALRMADIVSTSRDYPIQLCRELDTSGDYQKCLEKLDPESPIFEPSKIFEFWGLADMYVNDLKRGIQNTADWKKYHREQNELIEIARSNLKRIGL